MSFHKIVCIGQPKTGTTSMNRLFRHLGFRTVSNPITLSESSPVLLLDSEVRIDVVRLLMMQDDHDDTAALHRIMEAYDAFTDLPYSFLCHRFVREYPGTKFILTLRDSGDWFRSLSSYIRLPNAASRPVLRALYGSSDPEGHEREYRSAYESRNRQTIEYFESIGRSKNLLIINLFTTPSDRLIQTILEFLQIDPATCPDLAMPHENRQQRYPQI